MFLLCQVFECTEKKSLVTLLISCPFEFEAVMWISHFYLHWSQTWCLAGGIRKKVNTCLCCLWVRSHCCLTIFKQVQTFFVAENLSVIDSLRFMEINVLSFYLNSYFIWEETLDVWILMNIRYCVCFFFQLQVHIMLTFITNH